MKVWITNGSPEDLRVFKTKSAAIKWLRDCDYRHNTKYDFWQPKDTERGCVTEWDIYLEHLEVQE